MIKGNTVRDRMLSASTLTLTNGNGKIPRQTEEEANLQTSRWMSEVVERTLLVVVVEREGHPDFADEHKPERQEEQEEQWKQVKLEEQWEHVQG